MYEYNQTTGELKDDGGADLGVGYSGHGLGKNNPELQYVPNVGPIPEGVYAIGEPFNSAEHGPITMQLSPIAGTLTHGRDGFFMHGDSIKHPGEASLGCVIMPRPVRQYVAAGVDKTLHVVSGL